MIVRGGRICASCLYTLSRHPGRLPSLWLPPQRSLRAFSQSHLRAAFVPPTPESLGKAVPAKQFKRTRKWFRRVAYVFLLGSVVYVADRDFYASSLARTVRTFRIG